MSCDAGFQPAEARTARAKHLKTGPTTDRFYICRSTDRRQLRDMRRSGTTEAFRGSADWKDVTQGFGHSTDHSSLPVQDPNPVDIEQVQRAYEVRVRGALE